MMRWIMVAGGWKEFEQVGRKKVLAMRLPRLHDRKDKSFLEEGWVSNMLTIGLERFYEALCCGVMEVEGDGKFGVRRELERCIGPDGRRP